jgi:hypothetical protein
LPGAFSKFGEPLAALGKWSVAQAGSFQADQIEGELNNRNFLIASVGLEELKRRFPFIVNRSDLAVDDGLLKQVTSSAAYAALETPARDRWHILTHGHLLVKYVRRRHAHIQIAT